MHSTNSNLPTTLTTVVMPLAAPALAPVPAQTPTETPITATPSIANRLAPPDPRGDGNSISELANSAHRTEVRHFSDESDSDDEIVIIDGDSATTNQVTRSLQDALVDGSLERLKKILADQPWLVNQPIQALSCTPLVAAVEMKRPDIVDFLLSVRGIAIDARGKSGRTALHAACVVGDVTTARQLIHCGARVNTCDGYGTPLIAACTLGDQALVKMILKRTGKILVDFRPTGGFTAMKAAIEAGHPGIVKQLLRKGSDPNQRGQYGMTPLHHAAQHKRTHIAKLLLRHGAVQVSIAIGLPAELACMHDDVQTLGVLLKKMPDGQWWKRPLMQTAVRRDAAACLECLLAAGFSVTEPAFGEFTPLMEAVALNRVEVIRVLLSHGADPNQHTSSCESALSVAIERNSPMGLILMLLSAMGSRLVLPHDVAQRLVKRARKEQDFRILNELAARQIENWRGQPFDLQKALS